MTWKPEAYTPLTDEYNGYDLNIILRWMYDYLRTVHISQNIVYHWDVSRSKWLADLETYSFSDDSTAGGGHMQIGEVTTSATLGYYMPYAATLVGWAFRQDGATVGNWVINHDSTALVTTSHNYTEASDMTVNKDITAGTQLNIENSGANACTNPIFTVYLRRKLV